MLAILDVKDFDRWLDPAVQEPKKLELLLVPYAGDELTAFPIPPGSTAHATKARGASSRQPGVFN